MTLALDAGAEDVADIGEHWLVTTDPANFVPVRTAIEKTKIAIESAAMNMVPNMTVPVSATSTATAKLPICSRMILEISSAFMLIATLVGPAKAGHYI